MAGSLLDEPLNSYDGRGNVYSCTYPGRRIVNSTYDRLNRLKMVANSADLIATNSHFDPGRVERHYYGNGTRAVFSYDPIRRLTKSTHSIVAIGTNFESRAYAWYTANNQTTMNDSVAPTRDARSFNYDSLMVIDPSLLVSAHPAGDRDDSTAVFWSDYGGSRGTILAKIITRHESIFSNSRQVFRLTLFLAGLGLCS